MRRAAACAGCAATPLLTWHSACLASVMGGELFEYLINNGAYTEQLASKHVRRIAEALNYLHG